MLGNLLEYNYGIVLMIVLLHVMVEAVERKYMIIT